MSYIGMDDTLGKVLMLNSQKKMIEALSLLRRWKSLSWEDVIDMVTVGVLDPDKQIGMLEAIKKHMKDGLHRPCMVPDFDMELRIAISESFHIVDHEGGISALGSMVFEPDFGPPPWKIYNPEIIVANYNEGQFGRISGNPRMGKTSFACVLMEVWVSKNEPIRSN